jgi:hypothetical protein
MVKYYTEILFKYPILTILIQTIIIYYLIMDCKKNYPNFSWHDLGESTSFISTCAFIIGLLMSNLYLFQYYFKH